ncbi:MAG: transcription-repair coupling factor [Candidatus Sumerlaeia bacterium]|nr:transcription-repair coupling factor [Candidatus Sumerlaeia bacterium]
MNPDERWREAAQIALEFARKRLTERSETFGVLRQELSAPNRPVVLQNLEGSALAFVVAQLAEELKRPMLLLTAGMERAEQLADDLEFFGVTEAYHYPKWEVLPYDEEDLGLEITAKHLDVFEALHRARTKAERPLVIAPLDATLLRVLPPDALESLTLRFAWGDRLDLAKLAQDLDRAGYERVGLVEGRGEFSIRGSIVDIFPPNQEDPIRLDLFGDEIEGIKIFDIATQRSLKDLGTEVSLSIPGTKLKDQLRRQLVEKKPLESFYGLLPKNTIVLMDHPERFGEVELYFRSAVERQFEEVLHGESPLGPPANILITSEELQTSLAKFPRVEHTRLPQDKGDKATAKALFRTGTFEVTEGGLPWWLGEIRRRQNEDYLVIIACDNDGQVHRFEDVLRDEGLPCVSLLSPGDREKIQVHSAVEGFQDILLLVGMPSDGFLFHEGRIALLTDREIFGRYKRRHVYKKLYKGRPVGDSNEILRNDLVVHVDHGLGIYRGMRQQVIDGQTVDLLEILYEDNDKLLVPVDKIRYVQRFSGNPETAKLDKLGSNRWAKRRKKSREQVEELAEELLKLYALRETARRKPFGEDSLTLKQFEASFPYQETPDQLQAIELVKQDMTKHRPMDRLVCGDVGYGKTEVAIRAVFKCISEGRQAVVLVPTTILALQHFRNFRERYAGYDYNVQLLSRFQSAKEVKEIKEGLKAGTVHVAVGTHKLLGADVEYKNLGLLVVDEEQRFGVKAKERLKELRAELDILTLTATPIPRTLNMAMSGLRELSLITTPPPDRQPIKTKIIHWEEEPIAEAILRELNRGGQVFFIHNRVHNIDEVGRTLQKIVPHARIGIAHGQMDESELEEQMLKFIQGEFDILVSTTIVESGIDIPNANTIIVNRADAFGLAQLYQLRGRVGREKRRAYAYLIVPQGQSVTDMALKRLAAIEEFTELGSGFNIAMRDLEIRGAGNILGKEQHGVVMEIGFELYCEMLNEAVAKLKGEETHNRHDVEIKWPISSFIPLPYIPVETQRVSVYKRLATFDRHEDVADLAIELRDRYGAIPEGVTNLLEVTRLRIAAAALKVLVIDGSGPMVRIGFLDTGQVGTLTKIREVGTGRTGIGGVTLDPPKGCRVLIQEKNPTQRLVILRELLQSVLELLPKS